MHQFVEAVRIGDDSNILLSADAFLGEFNKISKEEKWKYLQIQMEKFKTNDNFDKIPNKFKFFSKIDDLLVPYDRHSTYLEPFDIDTIGPWKYMFDYNYKDMAPINGFTRCWNSIIIFHLMFGDRMLNSYTTQLFIHYLNLFTAEPFIEQSFGGILLKAGCRDAAVTLRVKLYIRCIWEEMTGKLDSDICFEVFSYLLKNPQRNTSQMKKWKSPLVACSLTKSAVGKRCQWNDDLLQKCMLVNIDKVNRDRTTYDRLRKEVDESLSSMIKSGLPKTAAEFKRLISAEVNYSNVSQVSILWFLEAVSGFMRSNYANTALKSVEDARTKERLELKPGNLMAKHYRDIWVKFLTWYVDRMPKTQEQFVIEAFHNLTTRSNGLNDFTLNEETGKYDVPNTDVHTFKIFRYDGKPMDWKVRDKAMTFRIDPLALFNYEKMKRSLTKYDPGRLFARYVPARDVRMVYGVSEYRYLSESITNYMADWFSEQRYTSMVGGTQHPISTLAIDTGRYLTDMGQYLKLTGGEQNTWILLADFSAFDQTQNFENWRKWQIEALRIVMEMKKSELAKMKFEILGDRDPLEYLLGNWESLKDAVFRIYTSRGNSVLAPTGWLLSGENATLVTNTSTNYAFMLALMDQMQITKSGIEGYTLSDVMPIDNFRLQGDDQISILPIGINQLTMSDKLTLETNFLNLAKDVAASGNLEIAVYKTTMRSSHFEFLKKAGIYGYAIPRYMQISLDESEDINRTMSPLERMRARLGQFREYEFRGGDSYYGLLRRYIEWNLIRSVNFGKDSEQRNIRMNLPFALLWTPVSLGGVGMHPRTNVDPNSDVMIGLYPWSDTSRQAINTCIAACANAPVQDNSLIVDQIKPHLKIGLELQKTYDYRVNLKKIDDSKLAMSRLMEGGMKDDPNAYFQRYDQELKEAIEDDKKMEEVNVAWKRDISYSIIKYWNEHLNDEHYVDKLPSLFIPGVKYEYGEILNDSQTPICPVAGLDTHYQLWMQQIGTSAEGKVITGDSFSRLSKILNRGNFPRNLKANNMEQIAATLLREQLVSAVQIQDFLIMRGADYNDANELSLLLENKLEMLKYLANVSAFSFIGEGFTNKSAARVNQVVKITDVSLDVENSFSQLIKAVGYQYMRTDDLWKYNDGKIVSNPRRYVKAICDERTIADFIIKSNTAVLREKQWLRMVEHNVYTGLGITPAHDNLVL